MEIMGNSWSVGVNEQVSSASLPRVAKGRHPYFFDSPAVDQLLSIVSALAGEVSVLRERSDALERLLANAGRLDREELDHFVPNGDTQRERDEWRAAFLSRIFRVIEVERANLRAGETPAAYAEVIGVVSDD
jgi:hypothetical protein